jgi:hypothetical protein
MSASLQVLQQTAVTFDRVSWDESKVFVHLSRDTIKLSPQYKENTLPTRIYETGLNQHYHRPGYCDKPEAAITLPAQ